MKTIPIKLNCSVEDKEHLLFLLNEKQKCFNYLSNELFKLDWKKYLVITKIHNKFYNSFRQENCIALCSADELPINLVK